MTLTGYLELVYIIITKLPPSRKTSSHEAVTSRKCFVAKLISHETVSSRNFSLSRNCLLTKLSHPETVFSRNCLLTKLLPHETATSPKGLSRTVSSRNCFPTKLFLHKLSILPKPFPRRNDRWNKKNPSSNVYEPRSCMCHWFLLCLGVMKNCYYKNLVVFGDIYSSDRDMMIREQGNSVIVHI